MPGFGIQKKGTSPILVKRKGFSEGSYPLVDEVPEPKMERMPSNEDKDYTPKKERMPFNDDKDYTPKKSDDEKKIIKGAKEGVRKVIKEVNKKKTFVTPTPRVNKAKGGSMKKGILIIIGTKDKESKKKKK